MITANKKVAVSPFPTTDTKTEVRSGMVVIKQRAELTKLTVVHPTEGDLPYEHGDAVYVRGDLCKHPLAKEIFEMGDKTFILIDASMVIGWERVWDKDLFGGLGQIIPPLAMAPPRRLSWWERILNRMFS